MKILLLLSILTSCSSISKYLGTTPMPIKSDRPYLSSVWIKNIDPSYETGNLPVALNSPLIAKGFVFNGSNEKGMIAYELKTGRELWTQEEKGSFHAPPVFHNDMIIYGTTEGRIFARDYLSGKLIYSVDLGASVEASPTLSKGRIVFHLRNHKIITLDVQTGKILWAYKRSVPFATTIQRSSTPLIYNNKIYVGFADGYVAAMSIEDGMILWEQKIVSGSKFVDVDATPVIFNKKLLIGSISGPVVELDIKTGKILRTINYNISRAPVIFKNGLLLGTVQGNLVWLDQYFKEIKKVNLESNISSIVFWKGRLVTSSVNGTLNILDSNSLNLLHSKYLGHSSSAIFGTLSVGEGKLALLSARNRLYVFQ